MTFVEIDGNKIDKIFKESNKTAIQVIKKSVKMILCSGILHINR